MARNMTEEELKLLLFQAAMRLLSEEDKKMLADYVEKQISKQDETGLRKQ